MAPRSVAGIDPNGPQLARKLTLTKYTNNEIARRGFGRGCYGIFYVEHHLVR